MRVTFPDISERQACRVLGGARPALHRKSTAWTSSPQLSEDLVARLHELIQQYPTYSYRRLWALLHYRAGFVVNQKAVYRVLRIKQCGVSSDQNPSASCATLTESSSTE